MIREPITTVHNYYHHSGFIMQMLSIS